MGSHGTRCGRRWASDGPPRYERAPRGSVADAFEAQIRALLVEWPKMPARVIAERLGWPHSMSPLKNEAAPHPSGVRGIHPVDRFVYRPDAIAQCDLRFPCCGSLSATVNNESCRYW